MHATMAQETRLHVFITTEHLLTADMSTFQSKTEWLDPLNQNMTGTIVRFHKALNWLKMRI